LGWDSLALDELRLSKLNRGGEKNQEKFVNFCKKLIIKIKKNGILDRNLRTMVMKLIKNYQKMLV